jgi:peptidoglycan LD-endopeptidase LytH
VADWQSRLRLVVVTATITSLAWILAGALMFTRQVTTGGDRAAAPENQPGEVAGPEAAAPSAEGLIIPVQGVTADQLIDTWGQSRDAGAREHQAIDIMAPRGTPVLAAAAGTVEKLFTSDSGGITVYIRSPDRRTIHYYAHLDRYVPGLGEGQAIRAGEVIGYVGSTGSAAPEGPHLHFAIEQVTPEQKWWEGSPVNPYPSLAGR